MDILQNINATAALTFVSFVFVTILVVRYNWQRRWLYYYGSKLEGPFAFPVIGNTHLFMKYEEIGPRFVQICHTYPSVFKIWITNRLIVINSKPEDIEVLLNTQLGKGTFYQDFTGDVFKNGLLAGPVDVWKRHRKIINPTFNQNLLNSFVEIFAKQANVLVDNLKTHSGKGMVNILSRITRCTLDIACESLTGLDANLVTGQDKYLKKMSRLEEVAGLRIMNPLFYPNIIWNLSPLGKECNQLVDDTFNFCKKLHKMHISKYNELNNYNDANLERKRFLSHLNSLSNGKGQMTEREILEELQTLLAGATETSAVVISLVISMMGIYQDVQEKVYHELHSIFGGSLREPTMEDVNKMEYLERVIKETMRLLPAAPIIMRYADETFELNNIVYPKGAHILIPIIYLHRKEEIWENPLVFDPDRFLPENSEKRHRCAYLPFSFGVRNCIGFKYGMISMKIILATFLQYFRVVSSTYKSLDDVKIVFAVIGKPRDGCMVMLERRD